MVLAGKPTSLWTSNCSRREVAVINIKASVPIRAGVTDDLYGETHNTFARRALLRKLKPWKVVFVWGGGVGTGRCYSVQHENWADHVRDDGSFDVTHESCMDYYDLRSEDLP